MSCSLYDHGFPVDRVLRLLEQGTITRRKAAELLAVIIPRGSPDPSELDEYQSRINYAALTPFDALETLTAAVRPLFAERMSRRLAAGERRALDQTIALAQKVLSGVAYDTHDA